MNLKSCRNYVCDAPPQYPHAQRQSRCRCELHQTRPKCLLEKNMSTCTFKLGSGYLILSCIEARNSRSSQVLRALFLDITPHRPACDFMRNWWCLKWLYWFRLWVIWFWWSLEVFRAGGQLVCPLFLARLTGWPGHALNHSSPLVLHVARIYYKLN